MRNDSFFQVAGLPFSVGLHLDRDIEALLPSFRPFRSEACPSAERIFRLEVSDCPFPDDKRQTDLLSESTNDLGHVRLLRTAGGYRIEINYTGADDSIHVMTTDAAFRSATAYLRPETSSTGLVLTSMLRILYAQAVLLHDGVSVHASSVCIDGKSYLFLGKSGTGKSTHARQWLRTFADCRLLNDDNPILRIRQGTVWAYGSPWSGKTPCYKNEGCPVGGIARLQQSATNRFTPLDGPEAFASLLPSCSVIRQDAHLQDALYRTLIQIAEQVPVGRLDCLPDREAAQLCRKSIHESNNKQS